MPRFPLSFFGFHGFGATNEEVNKGKRRIVTYLLFITFVLTAASLADEEWVSGGVEFSWDTATAPKIDSSCVGCSALPPLHMGDTVRRVFNLGLDHVTIDSAFPMRFTGVSVEQDCSMALKPFLDEVNAASTHNSSILWYGNGPIKYQTFQATQGLLAFSAALQMMAWLTMVFIQYEAPVVGSHPYSILLARIVTPLSLFFAIVGILVFGTSSIKAEFCKAFDPHPEFTGLPCNYGNGFNAAIAAIVILAITTALAWFWMSKDLGARYSFSSTGKSPFEVTGGAAPLSSSEVTSASSSSGSSALGNGYNAGSGLGNDNSSASTVPFRSSAYQEIGAA